MSISSLTPEYQNIVAASFAHSRTGLLRQSIDFLRREDSSAEDLRYSRLGLEYLAVTDEESNLGKVDVAVINSATVCKSRLVSIIAGDNLAKLS